ncbi:MULTISPECIES: polyphosphate polymerase domain-containing protein [Micromonospora]|uniref:polyphosphate polymerase domain-containing protein n=1 Tax=Micromonospora TaxID=1873 RepID=UPI0001C45872|nr:MULTISPECIES: polyphosphate polymerase domain-containing protein [Micromonospora]ADU09810.1 VTC domain protein [Micromonospora sp. L5]MBC9003290.1 polyphosphate polymerase domain-containing protein [Micromonospora aurantiaca]RNH97825.1 polyphosphate polymerase domain-containing protein [Micromonospora aurantiaca]SCL43513.1 VTC domain-containing protein [Micromonospora aurantiaca]
MRNPLRRRGVPPDPTGDGPPGPVPPEHPALRVANDQAGHALRAPSRLHAFNRYEIKYVMPYAVVPELREALARRLDLDAYAAGGGYGVWSVYYDTPDLRFYWEKIEGLRFRRKLRLRNYGDRFRIDDDSPVFVEIKQRVNRVTQKRRVELPYRLARDLCDRRMAVDHDPGQGAFLDEVLDLLCRLDLRAVAMTGYQREAFIGRDADSGLRVTIDHRVRGRDRDFHLGADVENRLIVPARLAVVELKADERVPRWLTDLTAQMNMSVVRVSKYCQSVEAFGRAPRSIFHVADDDAGALVPAANRSEA